MVKRLVAVAILLVTFFSVAISGDTRKRFTSLECEMMEESTTLYEVIRDNDTGVCYLYISDDAGSTMTPIYNADGSLYVANGWRGHG